MRVTTRSAAKKSLDRESNTWSETKRARLLRWGGGLVLDSGYGSGLGWVGLTGLVDVCFPLQSTALPAELSKARL